MLRYVCEKGCGIFYTYAVLSRCPNSYCQGNFRLLEEHVIIVRSYGQTYIARANGKTASCTSGTELAADRVARKLFGDRPYHLKIVNKYTFIATEGKS
jgi:hypothetical protein